MRKIIYYVAVSADGFISGLNDDISGFVQQGEGVNQYFQDLKDFDIVIMGRKTYEFGYKYGMEPGQPAYPNMKHYIFSDSLILENPHEDVKVLNRDLKHIETLKSESGSDIYLCGGGEFAGWLLDNQLIDVLKIKANPVVLGEGIRLFGSSKNKVQLNRINLREYDNSLNVVTYEIRY
ncbi:dihydrofolate reductase family protein [Emticicia sp. C21]|uniref:dihydrofolate reductase family protein n=1 Tax=Emticicia sp. C21 TaxID=2302915 RepID=UPI000E34417E|nr:dihydrofolate reductase family protein [Emticicia sp. C21]RFS14378.1 dihydrofolate reductase [Emticicia sp. C21]